MSSASPDHRSSAERNGHRNRGSWFFLLSVLGLYLGVHFINPGYSAACFDYFINALIRLLPAFGIMFLLLWLFNLSAAAPRIAGLLGRYAGFKGWLFAMGGGILSMGPMYLWYPLLRDLKSKGMRTSLLAAFLYSRAVKIPMLPFMLHYFGSVYTILFVVHVLLFSIASGLLMERISSASSENRVADNE